MHFEARNPKEIPPMFPTGQELRIAMKIKEFQTQRMSGIWDQMKTTRLKSLKKKASSLKSQEAILR